MTRYCDGCNYTDGMVYTSLPPQIKCTITNKYHPCNYVCDVDFVPVVRCKDCQWLGIKDYLYGYCRKNGLDGIVQPNDYCSRGEREEDEK